MRLFGHPVHVMLIHFPVVLWPTHAGLHLFNDRFPDGAAGAVGFWLLAAGTALGWLAALCGASDLLRLWRQEEHSKVSSGLVHATINGTVLFGFTIILALDYRSLPPITHGSIFLLVEGALLLAMFAGNHFGGKIIWGPPADPESL